MLLRHIYFAATCVFPMRYSNAGAGYTFYPLSNPTEHSERKKKKRQTEEEVGRQQEWTLPAQLGQLKTGKDEKGLLRIHLWCPADLPRLRDRIE